jgi:hypothetical protein
MVHNFRGRPDMENALMHSPRPFSFLFFFWRIEESLERLEGETISRDWRDGEKPIEFL